MNQIFEDAKDLHVAFTYIYAKALDAYAYLDSAKTVKIDLATLTDLFHKGIVIVDGGIEYSPVSLKTALGACTITYVKTDGTTATTAVLATVSSKEFV